MEGTTLRNMPGVSCGLHTTTGCIPYWQVTARSTSCHGQNVSEFQ
eukprot:CAMPEP_0197923366 /NCGR_PEP_ID=MMETSP1439-20131203/93852_1 /TAXON_ID=66791 /ORGANISM="Gonyaulax spinifera, Strain CCMP409" /LENGTH=44 /DNA_ID= /DNA_START= /DNA_END= /DNA_ORIENTATION=